MGAEAMKESTDEPTDEPMTDEATGQPEATEGQRDRMAEEQRPAQPTFGGMTPQEAGRKGAAERARRALAQEQAAAAASDGRVVLMRVPVPIGNIIARLAQDASRGNTQAARELRAYLEQFPTEDDTDVSALDRRTRQSLMARLLADIAEHDGLGAIQAESQALDPIAPLPQGDSAENSAVEQGT